LLIVFCELFYGKGRELTIILRAANSLDDIAKKDSDVYIQQKLYKGCKTAVFCFRVILQVITSRGPARKFMLIMFLLSIKKVPAAKSH
jgi:hypothetical protein